MLYKAMEKAFSTAGDTSLGLPLLPEEPEPHTPYRAAWLAPGPSTENACEKALQVRPRVTVEVCSPGD